MTDDEDLFAVRPAPKRVKARKTPPGDATCVIREIAPNICATGPVVSLACRCGAREEVKAPCPSAVDCFHCKGLETMIAYVPRFTPPATGGRSLTEREVEGMRLDGHR